MNRSIKRWLFKKATEVLGEEDYNSLKNDLMNPVKIAAREAAADFLGDTGKRHAGQDEDED